MSLPGDRYGPDQIRTPIVQLFVAWKQLETGSRAKIDKIDAALKAKHLLGFKQI